MTGICFLLAGNTRYSLWRSSGAADNVWYHIQYDKEVKPQMVEAYSETAYTEGVRFADLVENQKNAAVEKIDAIFECLTPMCFLECLLSINWNAEDLALSTNVPWIAIVPGILMILYDIICKTRGKKSYGAWAIGFCLLLIPIIVIGAAFLICGIFIGK